MLTVCLLSVFDIKPVMNAQNVPILPNPEAEGASVEIYAIN